MRVIIFTGALLCAVFGNAEAAKAQISELRVGITEFDERTLDISFSSQRANENSVGVNAEIIFEEPEFLKWALTPQPYINGTLNLEGNTSYAGAGLMWRQSFGDKFYADFSFGGVIHDGTKNSRLSDEDAAFIENADPSNPDDLAAARIIFDDFFQDIDSDINFGSRLLFREQLTLGYRVSEEWAAEVFFEHLSNAGLSESGTNEGVDALGFKAARRF